MKAVRAVSLLLQTVRVDPLAQRCTMSLSFLLLSWSHETFVAISSRHSGMSLCSARRPTTAGSDEHAPMKMPLCHQPPKLLTSLIASVLPVCGAALLSQPHGVMSWPISPDHSSAQCSCMTPSASVALACTVLLAKSAGMYLW